MRKVFLMLLLLGLAGSAWTEEPGSLRGRLTDGSGAAVSGARVVLLSSLGRVREARSDREGAYRFSNLTPGRYRLTAAAPGLASAPREVEVEEGQGTAADLTLDLAAYSEDVVVTASLTEAPRSEAAGSTFVMTREQIEARGAESVLDLLRSVPGLTVARAGGRGGQTSVFARGGEGDYNLVLIDGVPVNDFGGAFNFANLPADWVERMEVVRGPQSALYGSNAISSVIHLMSRPGAALPSIAASLEGGSHGTSIARARAAGASARWDWWASVSRERTGGRVENEDHQVGRLSLGFGAAPAAGQQLHVAFHYNDAESGFPGPYGTDPIGAFSGIDEVSRGDFRDLVLGADYDLELRPSFRLRLSGGAVGADGEFSSSFGDSFSEQRRGLLRAEGEWKLSERHRLAFGAELARESVRSTFITDDSFQPFRLERGQNGYFIEERFSAGRRLSVTAGLRVEDISTGPVPAALVFGRPAFPERSERSVNPKVAASLGLGSGVRLHGSAGTGIRPPDGFEIAFTNNPALEPEQTRSFDAGAELRLASGRLSLDATWFENRYDNLIVVLGRGASGLSRYSSDNLDNARSRGLELSWSASPLRGLILSGSYTYLATEILALDGDRAGALRSPFRVGQSLTRRPGHTLFQSVTWTRGGLTAQGSVLARSKTLDVEPNFGTFGGFFDNPGYARVDLAGSYRLWGPLAACARVENLLDRDYEDVLGYPALPFTASAGIRVDWRR